MENSTNINAYFGEVEEKKAALAVAKSEYESAVARLDEKKKEVGFTEDRKDSKSEETEAKRADKQPEEQGKQKETPKNAQPDSGNDSSHNRADKK